MHAYGPIEFKKQGPPVEALVNVLELYTKEFPTSGKLENTYSCFKKKLH